MFQGLNKATGELLVVKCYARALAAAPPHHTHLEGLCKLHDRPIPGMSQVG